MTWQCHNFHYLIQYFIVFSIKISYNIASLEYTAALQCHILYRKAHLLGRLLPERCCPNISLPKLHRSSEVGASFGYHSLLSHLKGFEQNEKEI
jgi:hypothetical protein